MDGLRELISTVLDEKGDLTIAGIVQAVGSQSGLSVDVDDVQAVLEELEESGFVDSCESEGEKLFTASHPDFGKGLA